MPDPSYADGLADTAAGEPRASLPLGVTAALVGEYRWIETSLYALLGGWVADMPIAGVQVHLDEQSMRHAWHAELWGDRLPVLSGADPDAVTRPSAATAAVFAALDGVEPVVAGPGSTWPPADREVPPRPGALPRLAALYRVVLPRLVTSYTRHLRVVAPVADGPLRRSLRLVLNDEVEDWLAGERMVQRLVTRPHDVDAVHEFQQRLESVAVAAGAHSGLVDLPGWVPTD
ncbi:MAG: hypothetical protein ABSF84_15715 [Acidimicrobiales bacterium]